MPTTPKSVTPPISCHPVDKPEGCVKGKERRGPRVSRPREPVVWRPSLTRVLCESFLVELFRVPPAIDAAVTSAMILFSNIRPVPDARVPTQAHGLARADHRMTRAALVVNRVRVRSLGAQHPVQPYRQFARRRHLGHALRLRVAAMRILLFELLVVPNRRLRGLDQHGAQKDVPLFGNGS